MYLKRTNFYWTGGRQSRESRLKVDSRWITREDRLYVDQHKIRNELRVDLGMYLKRNDLYWTRGRHRENLDEKWIHVGLHV